MKCREILNHNKAAGYQGNRPRFPWKGSLRSYVVFWRMLFARRPHFMLTLKIQNFPPCSLLFSLLLASS